MGVFTAAEGGFHNSMEIWTIHNKLRRTKGYISTNTFSFRFKNCTTSKYFLMIFEYFVFSTVYYGSLFSGATRAKTINRIFVGLMKQAETFTGCFLNIYILILITYGCIYRYFTISVYQQDES